MVRVIIASIIFTALAVAIGYTFAPLGGVWVGSNFINFKAYGINLPDARFRDEVPEAPVIAVSREGVFFQGRLIETYHGALTAPFFVVDALYYELYEISNVDGHPITLPEEKSYVDREIVILADEGVGYDTLMRILWTSARAGFTKPYLATLDRRTVSVTAIPIFKEWFFDSINQDRLYISVIVEEDGFRVAGAGRIFPFVRKAGSDYDYNTLESLLTRISSEYPERPNDLGFIFPYDMGYGEIIRFLELALSSGLEPERVSMSQEIRP